jgi:hypothetical protein
VSIKPDHDDGQERDLVNLGRSREGPGLRQFRPWLARFVGVCFITAAAGWHAMLASAAVANGPPAPSGLTASAVSSTAVTLSWNPVSDGQAPILGYYIFGGTSQASPVLISSVNAPATSYTVPGLTPSTPYQFEVAAYTDISNGAVATVTVTTLPVQQSQTISFPRPPDAAVGQRVTLTASASSGLPVAFGSGSGGACTVSGSAVTTVAPGTCTITASQGGNPDYAPAPSVTRSFHVTASQGGNADHAPAPSVTRPFQVSSSQIGHRAQTIEFARPMGTSAGRPVTLSASASSGLPVNLSSDTPRVCAVSGSAVSTVAPGTCTITASQGGNARYAAARPVTRSFRVDAAAPIRPNAPGPPTLVIALAAIGAATGLAGAVLVRLRLRSRSPLQPSIRAEPHAGPPGLVGVHAVGTERTQTVRIEPNPGTSSVRTRKASS